MILSVSGRTDVIRFFTPWFINRLKEGYVDSRNPFVKNFVSRIYFDDVDMFVFMTKDPRNIEQYLNLFKKPIIFQITITPYLNDIEPNVLNKNEIINSTNRISEILGKDMVVIRYDPIFVNDKYTIDFHLKMFEKLCSKLSTNIHTIIVSFLDLYKNTKKNMNVLKAKTLNEEDYRKIGIGFSKIAEKYNKTIQTCGEEKTLFEYGFIKGECLSKEFVKSIVNKEFPKWNARHNKYCNCQEMVDIGAYNTCMHGCKYCYANYSEEDIKKNLMIHYEYSSLLIGRINCLDKIRIRK